MITKKAVAWLVALALFAAGFGFFVGVDDANAATRTCTSSESNAIQSQQNQVNQRQTKVSSDQQKYNTAQGKLNKANAKVNELSAKRDASKKKIVDLTALAVKNAVSSPSISRGYVAQAKSETNVLNSLEGQLKSATTAAGSVNREASTTLTNLSRSQKDLADQQAKLATQRSRCRS
jgi:chromosome segregation ATPase